MAMLFGIARYASGINLDKFYLLGIDTRLEIEDSNHSTPQYIQVHCASDHIKSCVSDIF